MFVHWAWFVQPHAAAAWILWRHPERFPRAATMICAVFDLGLIGYFAVPTAPPWWAAVLGSGYRGTIEQLDAPARERVRMANLSYIRRSGVRSVEANVVYALATKT